MGAGAGDAYRQCRVSPLLPRMMRRNPSAALNWAKGPMKTPLCELLNIEVPIILAAMGGFDTAPLAAAVANAGGLGMMAVSGLESDDLRAQITRARALTDR